MPALQHPWARRARPLLGTLVEVGVPQGDVAAASIAFDCIVRADACLSRFRPDSDIGRFNNLPAGGALAVHEETRHVLDAAAQLHQESGGAFDISLGTGPRHWSIEGRTLRKHGAGVRLDLGGIGKGHAVDMAVQALMAAGVASGWVNAGGDLRVFGDAEVPIHLRDELDGGARPFSLLSDGALATSRFGPGSRAASTMPGFVAPCQVTVAAPSCLWADALTKIVVLTRNPHHPLLGRAGAAAWLRSLS